MWQIKTLSKVACRIGMLAVVLVIASAPSSAGIRADGKYSGVVFFDRWDTCVLISGPYVMYISDELKSGFRSFAGQAVEVDATDVLQPMNPGDGLIRKYNWIAPAPKPHRFVSLDGLELLAESTSELSVMTIEIRNNGNGTAQVRPDEIGITVFGTQKSVFSPSDGRSEAVITRSHLMKSSGLNQWSEGDKRWHAAYRAGTEIPGVITLKPGASYKVDLTFDLSPGEYQFLFGYGGGVHEEESLLSNAVSFDIAPQTDKSTQ